MPAIAKPWTLEEIAERDALRDLRLQVGALVKDCVVFAGLEDNAAGRQHVHDFFKGKRHMSPEQMSAMRDGLEKFQRPLSGAVDESDTASAPETVEALAAMAGEPHPDEKDELRGLARNLRKAAVGSLVRLMTSARSETVRLRATEALLERSDGRAIQQVVDLTPKPPAESHELLSILEKLVESAAYQAQSQSENNEPSESTDNSGS